MGESRRRAPRFEPRFTVALLYVFGLFFAYCLMLVAPPLWELWAALPPGAEDDAEVRRHAAEVAREIARPRLWVSLAAALLTTALGSYAGLLPGTGRGADDR